LAFGDQIQVVRRTPLFSTTRYRGGVSSEVSFDVTRNGREFILVRAIGEAPRDRVVLTLGWVEELRRRLAGAENR
jgi:hypothetical protein